MKLCLYMKKYLTIIFDFDGTLVDSRRGVLNSFRYSLEKFGLSLEDEKDPVKFIGPPLLSVFREFYSMDEADALKAVDYYREYYGESGVFETDLYRGIEELLRDLKDDGREMMIATTKAAFYMEMIVKNLGIEKFFVKRTGSNLDGSLSNKAELIRHVLDGYPGTGRWETVMVGDRKFDIVGARENGIDSLAVAYGYGTAAELRDAGPNFTVGSVRDLRDFLL
jgi:phosphoglycolate phosphatase